MDISEEATIWEKRWNGVRLEPMGKIVIVRVLPLYDHIVRLPRLVGVVTTRNRRSYYTRIYDVQFPSSPFVV